MSENRRLTPETPEANLNREHYDHIFPVNFQMYVYNIYIYILKIPICDIAVATMKSAQCRCRDVREYYVPLRPEGPLKKRIPIHATLSENIGN